MTEVETKKQQKDFESFEILLLLFDIIGNRSLDYKPNSNDQSGIIYFLSSKVSILSLLARRKSISS